MNFEEEKNIPGIISVAEEEMLFEKSKNIPLKEGDILVEIGPLFGKSTKNIVRGLLLNSQYNSKNCLYVYDSYEYNINHSFAQRLIDLAKEGNVLDKLKKKSEYLIDFEHIFIHYLNSYIQSKNIISIKDKFTNVRPPENNAIALIRLNLSKKYSNFKPILFRFFPQLKNKSIVVFDNFFSQWSASIMLVAGILVNRGCLSIIEPVESSLVCSIKKIPADTDLIEMDLIMQDVNQCLQFFDVIDSECKKTKISQPETLLAVIVLAKIQWLYARGKHGDAKDILLEFFNNSNHLAVLKTTISPYLDLLGNGFSIDQMNKTKEKLYIPNNSQ